MLQPSPASQPYIPVLHPKPRSQCYIPALHPSPASLCYIPALHPNPTPQCYISTPHPNPASQPYLPAQNPCATAWPCIPVLYPIPQVLSQADRDTQLSSPRLFSPALLFPLEARSCRTLLNVEAPQPNELGKPLGGMGQGTLNFSSQHLTVLRDIPSGTWAWQCRRAGDGTRHLPVREGALIPALTPV